MQQKVVRQLRFSIRCEFEAVVRNAGYDDRAVLFARDSYEIDLVTEQSVLQKQPFEIFKGRRVDQFQDAAWISDDRKAELSGIRCFEVGLLPLVQPHAMLFSAAFHKPGITGWQDQAVVFAGPREEVARLASAENFSLARRSSSRWARACSEVTRG